jgi:ADP-heptose:LPS heptosyltransferase
LRILYGRVFGLGNAIMGVPAIKALSDAHEVHVMVGSTMDDPGAYDVMSELRATTEHIHRLHVDRADMSIEYDVAIMAMPFDGRWQNGVHFNAKRVIDGKPRPGDPNVLGLQSWKRHEVEYQMDNAVYLGWEGNTPSCRFAYYDDEPNMDLVYVGMGFKRDANSFWSKKHWGNDRFVAFMDELRRIRPGTRFITTGGNVDLPVLNDVSRRTKIGTIFAPLKQSFREVARAGSFFGNDTGMAHVAASFDRPTYMMTAFEGSETKNPPFCSRYRCNPFHTDAMDPESVAADFLSFVWGNP